MIDCLTAGTVSYMCRHNVRLGADKEQAYAGDIHPTRIAACMNISHMKHLGMCRRWHMKRLGMCRH